MGISIWLVPPPAAYGPLNDLISTLAGRYSAPNFLPHITLLSLPSSSSIKADAIIPPVDQLPAAIPIEFAKVCAGETYFQSVLIELKVEEDSELKKLRDALYAWNQEHLARPSESETDAVKPSEKAYYPHISLYYGDPGPEARQYIISDLEDSGVVVNKAPVTVAGVTGGFTASEVWVMRTDGPTGGWYEMHKIVLREKAKA